MLTHFTGEMQRQCPHLTDCSAPYTRKKQMISPHENGTRNGRESLGLIRKMVSRARAYSSVCFRRKPNNILHIANIATHNKQTSAWYRLIQVSQESDWPDFIRTTCVALFCDCTFEVRICFPFSTTPLFIYTVLS